MPYTYIAACYWRATFPYKRAGCIHAALPDSPVAACLARCASMAGTLNMDSRGAGDPQVLFLHSFAGDCTHWSPVLEHFVLVGHSLGALVAIEFAASAPQRVRKLILVDPPSAPGAVSPDVARQIREAVVQDPYTTIEQYWKQQPFVNARPETQRRLLLSLHKLARNAAIELTEDSLNYDASQALRQYSGPRFAIVTLSNDTPRSLHHIEYAVIEGTGHWIQLDRPIEFIAVLERLLRR
jgi:pimeloyl-ACP methyl ester carboxylesterase